MAKVASDAEKPAGFVVLTREQACARFANAPPGLVPGIGPKTAARLAELGLTTLAALGGRARALLVERFGPNLGVELRPARALRTRRRRRARAQGASRSRASGRSTATSTIPPRAARGADEDGRRAVREPRSAHGRQRAHDRHQGRLDDFTTVTRAHTLETPTSDVELVTAVALRLLAEYAPPRPVRLLGVRVAG